MIHREVDDYSGGSTPQRERRAIDVESIPRVWLVVEARREAWITNRNPDSEGGPAAAEGDKRRRRDRSMFQ